VALNLNKEALPVKALVIQRLLPQYRYQFYTLLSEKLKASECDFKLFFGDYSNSSKGTYAWEEKLHSYRIDFQLGELSTSLVVMPLLYFTLKKSKPDIIVTEDLANLPNSLTVSLYCRLHKKTYLIWGLGKVPGKKRSILRKVLGLPIRWLYSGASGYICYSEYAKSVYKTYDKKKPCFVATNSCVPPPSKVEIIEIKNSIKEKYTSKVLHIAYIGALLEQKRIDVMLRALAKLDSTSFQLHIIGGGKYQDSLTEMAYQLNIEKSVIFHGPIYDKNEKKSILMNSHIGLLPGRGGLAIQEMMWHGLPVISGIADGTEKDLINNGINGFLIDGFPSEKELIERILQFQSFSILEKQLMGETALETIINSVNLDKMADEYYRAIKHFAKSTTT